MPRSHVALISTFLLVCSAALAGAQTASLIPGAHREASGASQRQAAHGKELFEQGHIMDGLIAFQGAFAADSLSSQAAENLGIAYQTANLPHPAYDAFRRATELDPTSASAWNRAGQVLLANLG